MYRKKAFFSIRRLGICCFALLAGLGSGIVLAQIEPPANQLVTAADKEDSTVKTDSLSFETLARGDSYTAELVEPRLVVVSNSSDASRLARLLDEPQLARRIRLVDFERVWIVGIFRGQMGSTGYGIVIQEISIAQEKVRLRVNFTDPAPALNVSDVITYPYHIVVLARENFQPTPQTTWRVHTPDGKLLLQVINPSIP